MPQLTYTIDKNKSQDDASLVIKIENDGKPGQLTSGNLKKLASEQELEAINFLIQEELQYQKKLNNRQFNEITGLFNFIHISYAQSIKALKLLAATGKLLFEGRKLVCDFFGKTKFYFLVESAVGNNFKAIGKIKYREQDFLLNDCDFICAGPPHWFIKGVSLKLISTDVSWKDLREAYQGILSQDRLHELLQDNEQGEENADSLEFIFSGNSKETLEIQQSPFPILMLKDRHGAFADLWMNYGNGKSFLLQNPASQTTFKRQNEAEKAWERDLLETSYIKKDMGSSHYYCPIDKVAKSLCFLLEVGWEIRDWQGNRVVRQSKADLTITTLPQNFSIKGKVKFEEFDANLSDVVGAFNRREQFVKIGSGTVGLLPENLAGMGLNGLIEEGEIVKDSIEIPRNRIGSLSDLFNSNTSLLLDETSSQLKENLKSFQGIKTILPHASFQGTLRHYQQEGLNWLSFLYEFGFHGILADDMGLGKTVQVLAFLSNLEMRSPVLIAMPTSLIFNWKKEIEKFLPEAIVIVHHGSQRSTSFENFAHQNCIILTSYTTLRLDLPFISKIYYECIILDEAQAIKNPLTQIAQAIFSLKARFRLSISGTPIENHLNELWSQFHFLMPDLLGEEKDFNAELQTSTSDPRYFQRLKKKIKPFILRRRKEEVAKELPEKIEQVVWIEMGSEQRQIYEDFLSGVKGNLFKKVEKDGIGKHRMEIFEAILRLRQICCHPLLISAQISNEAVLESAKMEALIQDLETVLDEGAKVLVYSQFTSMLTLIAKSIKEKGWKHLYLDGSTIDREKVVRQFQEDSSFPIFLISLKAGGIGLNLTAADYVFLYDPWWNEAVENQAIDRAHRIGRQDTVIAKRYVVMESIEEKILKLKAIKKSLVSDVLDHEMENLNLTLDDLQFLIT